MKKTKQKLTHDELVNVASSHMRAAREEGRKHDLDDHAYSNMIGKYDNTSDEIDKAIDVAHKKYITEEVNPFQFTGKGKIDVKDSAVRDNINTLLTGVLMPCTLTPYIALEKVRKVLAYYHISIPGTSFMEGDRGVKVFDVEQFGLKFGMKNDGSVVNFSSVAKDLTHGPHEEGESFNSSTPPETNVTDEKFHIYFEYKMNDKGLFDVFSEIVTDDELQDLLADAEEDINSDSTEDDRDEKLNESIKSKAKRLIRKVTGKQSQELTNKLDKALDDRQIQTLGHKADISNKEDKEKLHNDKRYHELNRRYISAKYGNDEPGYRKLTSKLLGGKQIKEDAKRKASAILREMKLVGDPETPTNSQQQYLSRQSRTVNPTGSTGSIKHVGTPTGIPSRSELETAASRTTAQSGMETPGNKTNPKDAADIIRKTPEAKPMSSSEMQSGGYSQKIQETSHESVNHVRRLAVKKRNDR